MNRILWLVGALLLAAMCIGATSCAHNKATGNAPKVSPTEAPAQAEKPQASQAAAPDVELGIQIQPTRFVLRDVFARPTIEPLVAWLKDAPPNAVVVIDSPGGDLRVLGLALEAIGKRPDVLCLVDGTAGSAAFVFLQACGHRAMTKTSRLANHEPSRVFGAQGPEAWNRHELRQALKEIDEVTIMFNTLSSLRLSISPAEYNEKVADGKQWNMTAQEALQVGAVDQVLN